MSRSTNLLIALAGLHNHGSFHCSYPEVKPKVKTQADLDRLQKAAEKRLMKELKRLGHRVNSQNNRG